MKNIFFLILFSATTTLFAQTNEGKENYNPTNAQTATKALDLNDPYVKGMKTGIQIMDKAMNVGQLEQAANFLWTWQTNAQPIGCHLTTPPTAIH